MGSLVNTQQVESLIKLYNEFNSFFEFEKLYNSAQVSCTDLLLDPQSLFDPNNKKKTTDMVHLVKNKFKNIGMDYSAEILNEIRSYVESDQRCELTESDMLDRLKKSVHSSFIYIADNYLG